MDHLIRLLHQDTIKELFIENDVDEVFKWLEAINHRKPVVFVGSGLSRNAFNPSKAPIPLWSDMLELFKSVIHGNKDNIQYDPLHLAELYHERMGEALFTQNVLNLFPDQKVAPGKVHKALFEYNSEAIITTNNLDTLLDKDTRFVKVVDDIDLIKSKHDVERDVIYLHGHRDRPDTWAITRSQYEDIPSKKPGIISKVRQLVIQHPFLFLGYSLVDPDFHMAYREIWKMLKNNNYPGLAICISEPEPSEKMHWKKLGISLVTLKPNLDIQSALVKFLKIQPDLKDNHFDLTLVKKHLHENKKADIFLKKLKSLNMKARSVWQLRSKDYSSLWWSFAQLHLSKEKIYELEYSFLKFGKTSEEIFNEYYGKKIWRFNQKFRNNFMIRIINELLDEPIEVKSLWDWLLMGLKEDVDVIYSVEPADICLAMIALVPLMSKDSENIVLVEKGLPYISKVEKIYTNKVLKLELDELRKKYNIVEHASVQANASHNPVFFKHMELAFKHALNSENKKSFIEYSNSIAAARDAIDLTGEWLAIRSALLCDIGHDEEAAVKRRDLNKRKLEIEKDTVVSELLKKEEESIKNSESENYEVLKNELERIKKGDRHYRSNNHYYTNYLLFRRYEASHVHPEILKKIINPLIEGSFFSQSDEVSLRLKLNFKSNQRFFESFESKELFSLRKLYEKPELMTQTDLHTRLEAFRSIFIYIEPDHLVVYEDFLKFCFDKLKKENKKSFNWFFKHEYSRLWLNVLMLKEVAEAKILLIFLIENLEVKDLIDVAKDIKRLPWQEWFKDSKEITQMITALIDLFDKTRATSCLSVFTAAIKEKKVDVKQTERLKRISKSVISSNFSKDVDDQKEVILFANLFNVLSVKNKKIFLKPFNPVVLNSSQSDMEKLDNLKNIENTFKLLGGIVQETKFEIISKEQLISAHDNLLPFYDEYWNHLKRNKSRAYYAIVFEIHYNKIMKINNNALMEKVIQDIPEYVDVFLNYIEDRVDSFPDYEDFIIKKAVNFDHDSFNIFIRNIEIILDRKLLSFYNLIQPFLSCPVAHYNSKDTFTTSRIVLLFCKLSEYKNSKSFEKIIYFILNEALTDKRPVVRGELAFHAARIEHLGHSKSMRSFGKQVAIELAKDNSLFVRRRLLLGKL